MSNRAKPIITGLIQTMQRKLEPEKVYSTFDKMHVQLDEVWTAVFEGPVPKNFAKTLDLTQIPRENIPPVVALTDKKNIFSVEQIFQSTIKFPHIDPATLVESEPFTIEITGPNATLIGQDIEYDAGGWLGDGVGLFFHDNMLEFVKRVGGVKQGVLQINADGIVTLGPIPSTAGAQVFDIVVGNERAYRFGKATDDGTFIFAQIDSNDVIRLGDSALPTGKGHVAVPDELSADLPPASATMDGIVCIDKTNLRLVFYTGGARYRVSGVAF